MGGSALTSSATAARNGAASACGSTALIRRSPPRRRAGEQARAEPEVAGGDGPGQEVLELRAVLELLDHGLGRLGRAAAEREVRREDGARRGQHAARGQE